MFSTMNEETKEYGMEESTVSVVHSTENLDYDFMVESGNVVKYIGTLYKNWRLSLNILSHETNASGKQFNIIRVGTDDDPTSQI